MISTSRSRSFEGEFDCIICGDVLEHLIDPLTILRGLVAHLPPHGVCEHWQLKTIKA